jgi:hypothetical protein
MIIWFFIARWGLQLGELGICWWDGWSYQAGLEVAWKGRTLISTFDRAAA